ncbi:unnamed protein product [Gemmata massiliana]|uniref:Uncharacterized protein n=1 Tax=Gemmata massiliana TaxID=1210884 RepID=A0A6P2D4J3_9BACT|nr:hypothetical protein [Gemmata massiliana]VTR95817.1 unnamed protein product [Gemmata massiliana]
MSGDPFSGLSDTFQDRKQRDGRVRKQKWIAFWVALGVAVLVAVAAGLGAAFGGWATERDARIALDRIAGGVLCGLFGGALFFTAALWGLMRQSVFNDTRGDRTDEHAGTILFWSTIMGTALFGIAGATLGLTAQGAARYEVLACAGGATLLALVPAFMLRNLVNRKSRTGSSSTPYRSNS